MAKVGRKHKYATHVEPRLKEIEWWCRDGLTEKEICKRLGINVATLDRYKKKFCALCDTLKRGKEIPNYEIEDSLFKRAKGITYTETKRRAVVDALNPTEVKMVPEYEIEKYVPPDTKACINWLVNRKRESWVGERTEQNVTHSMSKMLDEAEKRGNGGKPQLKVVGNDG